MRSQPTPTVTSADVERILRRDFPDHQVAEARTILNTYGEEGWEREPDRVRLAALKLAAGTMNGLRQQINIAKSDYRDVLAAAEYPRYMRQVRPGAPASSGEREQIIEADWKQYSDWLARR